MTSGLKLPQLSLLNHLKRLGPLSITDLSREIRLERTTLVRNLKPLIERGFIEDAPGKNARIHQVRITEAGLEIVEKALPLWTEAQDFFENYLGDEGIAELNKLLSKIEGLAK
jgi:Transcriptional regulators